MFARRVTPRTHSTMQALSDTIRAGWFPLIAAVDAGDGEAVATLLEAGDDANQAVVAPSDHPTIARWQWIGSTPLLSLIHI